MAGLFPTPMKIILILLSLLLVLTGCAPAMPEETNLPTVTEATAVPTEIPTLPSETPETIPETTLPPLVFTEEEEAMLLKLAMAELGETGCVDCLALVMRTVLNRVEAGGFGSSIKGVILAEGQFTPVSDGSYYRAQPNDACFAALDLVRNHWDESQGALYYEFCEGESWHSRNLQLLFSHCNTRFYK